MAKQKVSYCEVIYCARTPTPPPAGCSTIHPNSDCEHPSAPIQAADNGINIPFKVLIDKFQFPNGASNVPRKIWFRSSGGYEFGGWKPSEKHEWIQNLLGELEGMPKDKLKAFGVKFWDIVQGNLSGEKYFSEVEEECANIKTFNTIIEKHFGKVFPEEFPEHKEKVQGVIAKAWEVIETKLINEDKSCEAEAKSRGSNPYFQLEDGTIYLKNAVKALMLDTLPLEGFSDHWTAITNNPNLYKKMKASVVDFWNDIKDKEIRDRCDSIEKLFKTVRQIFLEEIQKHEEKLKSAIAGVWWLIE